MICEQYVPLVDVQDKSEWERLVSRIPVFLQAKLQISNFDILCRELGIEFTFVAI